MRTSISMERFLVSMFARSPLAHSLCYGRRRRDISAFVSPSHQCIRADFLRCNPASPTGKLPSAFWKLRMECQAKASPTRHTQKRKKNKTRVSARAWLHPTKGSSCRNPLWGGRAGEPKSENHTDDFTETENKTITNTENRVADFTVIENKRFVAAILRCGCRKVRCWGTNILETHMTPMPAS